MTICNHIFKISEHVDYEQCEICGSFHSLASDINIYSDGYWTSEKGHSTLEEQIYNVNEIQINGFTKNDLVLKYCSERRITSNSSVLEIACAPGILLKRLNNYFHAVDGIEVDPANKEQISEIAGTDTHVVIGNFPEISQGWKVKYDAIIALDVFEHVEDGPAFINECCRLIKSGGMLILMLPIDFENCHAPEKMFAPVEHNWIYSEKAIRGLLSGFDKIVFDKWTEGHDLIVSYKSEGI